MKFHRALNLCPALTVTGLILFGCGSDSSPTGPAISSAVGESTSSTRSYASNTAGQTYGSSYQGGARHSTASYGNVDPAYPGNVHQPGAAASDEQFNCTNVKEVYVRFSDPGFVEDNNVGVFVLFVGMPPGQKRIRIWWDFENQPGNYRDFRIGEGEVQRDDDGLFDYEGIIEHAYMGLTRPTKYRVRVEMIVDDQTGNCARVRDITVSPGTATVSVPGQQLVTNGGFESGDFTGWTKVDSGSGTFSVYSGTAVPGNGLTVLAPPEGTFAAVTDQTGPGSHILYQDVTIPAGASATFSAVVYIENAAGTYFSPPSLSQGVSPNQQMRVDIMNPAAPVTDVGAGVLLNVFQTNPGDSASIGYTNIGANLSAFAGQTVRIRIAEVDNQFFFSGAVDNVSVIAQ